MIPDEDLTRIAAYLAAEGSPDERAETERWIAADAERRDMVGSLRQAWAKAGRDEPPVDLDRAWDELQRRRAARNVSHDAPVRSLTSRHGTARSGEVSPPAAPKTPSRRRSNRRVIQLIPRHAWRTGAFWLRAAAVVAVAGVGALAARLVIRAPVVESPASAMREIATARGQRATLTLSDGSRVDLGVASKLRFAEGFGGARRDVYLEGEAVFEVEHDSLRPFVVHTERAIATDLGTTFVVRDYASDSSVTVAVRKGAVELRAAGLSQPKSEVARTMTLEAGEFGRVDHLGNLASRRGNIDEFFAWAEGRLAFRDAPLDEVAIQLERWYNVDIELGAGTQKRTINATFGDDGIETTLDLIANATNVRVVRRGKIYLLTVSPERP
jgi:ferric-dicitrate binding protein FerR (iron transport regulator)